MQASGTESALHTGTTAPRRATFFGTAFHKLTLNNQVAIPRPMLEAMKNAQEGALLLTRVEQEPYLRLYTEKRFNEKLDAIRTNPHLDFKTRTAWAEQQASTAEYVEPDKQGRIVLPSRLVEAVQLQGEIAFCGVQNYVQVWPARLKKEQPAPAVELTPAQREQLTEIMNG